jgi:hypothetical protein|tara:strand:+ start:3151 stop:3387 length:237 start_codon:yes stop_codon:yes gene_type:complete
MVDGVTPHGAHLFPAMPYENFRHMSESDIRALAFRVVEQPDVLKDIASSGFAGSVGPPSDFLPFQHLKEALGYRILRL